MKKQRMLAAAVTAAMLLSGCRAMSLNGRDILTPPKAAGSRAEIQRMIEEDAGGSCTLIAPAESADQSGILLYDLDRDGTDEAIALYTDNSKAAHVLVARREGSSYRRVGAALLSSPDIHRLSFADVDADGRDELLIQCDAGVPLARLNAYFIGNGLTEVEIAEGCSDYLTGDFDGNIAADVLLLMPPSVEATSKAQLMVYGDGSFSSKSEAETDPTIVSYPKLSFGKLNEDTIGAAVDGVSDGGEYSTQLLYYDMDSHALINPLFLNATYPDTRRSCTLTSTDIDGDGTLEFPMCELMEYQKDEDAEQVCRAVHWCGFDSTQLEPAVKRDAVLSESMGFMLLLKDGMLPTVTARQPDDNTMVLYALTHKGNEPAVGKTQLTVKRYDKGGFDSSLIPEAVLYENNTSVYTYILAEKAVYTDDDVKNSFMLINSQ